MTDASYPITLIGDILKCYTRVAERYIEQITPEECTAIARAAVNPSSVLGGSIYITGGKYMVLRADEGSIYCRKVEKFRCRASRTE